MYPSAARRDDPWNMAFGSPSTWNLTNTDTKETERIHDWTKHVLPQTYSRDI